MNYRIINADVIEGLAQIESESIQCCVTSPPYWGLRDYGVPGQIGLEKTPEEYVAKMVEVFREVRRVLKKDGVLWLNLGDSYAGSGGAGGDYAEGGLKEGQPKYKNEFKINRAKDRTTTRWGCGQNPTPGYLKPKDLVGIPWRVAFALQADGWWLRSDVIWAKPNPMPESVTDRPTKAHEYIFLLTKSQKYYYDSDAIATPLPEVSQKRYQHSVNTNEKFDPKKHKSTNGIQSPMEVLTRAAQGVLDRGTANRKTVWTIATQSFNGAHFATFPPEIPELCIKAGSRPKDTALDCFAGKGTTGEVALRLDRKFIGIELNSKYVAELIIPNLESVNPLFAKTEGK